MGDRTSFQAYVYDCPEDQRQAALTVLAETYGLSFDWDSGPGPDALSLDRPYTEHEMSCGSAQEVAAALHEAAPGASFVLWEDPAYDWLGEVQAYAPALGEFSANCDANGEPVYTRGEIASMVRQYASEPDANPETIVAAIYAGTGAPWFDDWHGRTA